MTLAAVAPTCGDLHRAHLEGLQQTLLRCLHFVSYSFSSKSLGATCSAENLSAAPFFFSHLFKIPTKFSCIDLLLHVKLPEEYFANWYFITQTTTCLLCSGHVRRMYPTRSSLQNRRYLFALFRGNEAGAKRHSRAPSTMGSMSYSQMKLCVAYN